MKRSFYFLIYFSLCLPSVTLYAGSGNKQFTIRMITPQKRDEKPQKNAQSVLQPIIRIPLKPKASLLPLPVDAPLNVIPKSENKRFTIRMITPPTPIIKTAIQPTASSQLVGTPLSVLLSSIGTATAMPNAAQFCSPVSSPAQLWEDVAEIRKHFAGIIKFMSLSSKDSLISNYARFIAFESAAEDVLKDPQRFHAAAANLGLPKAISDSILGSTWERRELLRRQLLSCAKQSHHRKTYLEGNPPSIFKPSAKKYLKNLDRLSNMNLLALKDMGLAAISDPSMAELITSVLAKFVDSIDYLKKEDSSDPGRNLLRAFFLNYFNSAGPLVRRDLVSGLFNGKVDQVSDEALHNILDSSGPVMHKALQLLSENANSEKVKNLLNNFKSNIKPMGEAELDLAKEKAFQGKEAKYLKEFNPRPLAVASIGEVHLARSVKDNRELVVKLKKPDLLAKSTEEFAQMQRIVENMGNTPALVDIVAAMKKSMAQELNFVREVRKLKQGQIYARPQQGINVVEPLEDAEFEDAIVMEKAKGENIHKIVDDPESICVKSKFLTEIMSNWISAALFGNGYFNGDFHAGNILLDFQANQASEVTLIDFGNSKHLSRVERTALIELIIGANYDDAAMISSAFHNIQSSNTGSDAMKSKLEAMTQRAFQENSASEKVSYLLKNAISDGFHLSDGIVLFNRGRMLLEKQIKAINLKIANGEAPSCRETKIADIYKDKFKEGFTKPAVIWMFGVNRSRELKKKINAIKAQKEAETLSKTLGRAPTRNLRDSEFRSDLLS